MLRTALTLLLVLLALALGACSPPREEPATQATVFDALAGRQRASPDVCVAYTADGQHEPSALTCSEVGNPVVMIEVVNAREVPCDRRPPAGLKCKRVPRQDVLRLNGATWLLVAHSTPCGSTP